MGWKRVAKENKFKYEDLKKSKDFITYQDVLSVVMEENEELTKKEAFKKINDFLKKEVK